ncbi:FG-GAP repeat domain-containing protein [Paludisphaera mucosa]|uniref:VCBS repeat-containing protein n=1 Tax=Paludisphaera mucosa TaxID=3030827 RepID=A0ABT6F6C2_9BACT|nr:VCBS repeat-containing protein [Paludisphaera mucosa]MDG3003136.1 VCBS repeat-containing protein [Paludisphaera mucosa]
MKRMMIAAAFAAGASWLASSASAGEPKWKQHTINGKSEFEAAGVLDVDGDGKLDVVSGDTWYQAPDWKPHPVRPVDRVGTYYNDFATLPIDADGDGDIDVVTASYFGKDVAWLENPGKGGGKWAHHPIDTPGTSEAAAAVDLSGDGVPDILPNSTNVVVWYEVAKKADGKGVEFKKHDFGTAAAGHGVGSGDVNGDGRVDLLTPKGWFEAPADASRETWAWHPDWELGTTGIQITAKDVDGDGLSDLVYGMGHDFGLYWAKQSKGVDGKSVWTKAPIDETVASVHTQLWADVDGDGKADELISGKRVYAHEIEPGATDGSLVAWYKFDPKSSKWNKHVVFQGQPAKNAPEKGADRLALRDFPAGTAGTGLQVTAIDIDRDGDVDLVCPGKSGLYLFENLGSGK